MNWSRLKAFFSRPSGPVDPTDAYEDRVIDRDRSGRRAFFFTTVILILLLSLLVFIFFVPPFWPFGIVVGLALDVALLGKTIFVVPQLQALTSLNGWTGEMVAYGPGWHFRYPWEKAHMEDNISLKEITETFSESFPTQDARIDGEFSFGYRPRLDKILLFQAVGPSTVREGFQAFIKSQMATHAGTRGKSDIIGREQEINNLLQDIFEIPTKSGKTLEEEYGIDAKFVKVNRFQLSPEVQKALDAKAEQAAMADAVAAMFGYTTMEALQLARKDGTADISQDMLDRAWDRQLIIAGQPNASRHVFVGEGDAFGAIMGGIEAFGKAAAGAKSATTTTPKKRVPRKKGDNQ